MDDRDKAGDPDSNPEIDDDDDSDISMKEIIMEPLKKEKQSQHFKKSETFTINKFRDDVDQSVMMDSVVFDMGQRLSKVIGDFKILLTSSDKKL